MIKINKKYKFVYIILLLALLLNIVFVCPTTLCATNTVYSDVLEDLKTDTNFNINNYPVLENDYTPKVIQIAESSNKELFVYVYRPTGLLEATSINICRTEDVTSYVNYELKLLNYNGTLCKYLVKDFVVSNDTVRYYNISSIFRVYNSVIDKAPTSTSNTISEVSFEVGQLWTLTTENGQIKYDCVSMDVITITDKYVGFVRYPNGFNLSNNVACDSHYVAFSTDKDIDLLLEADVYYVSCPVRYESIGSKTTYGEDSTNYVTLRYTEVVSNPAGLFGKKYVWNRIQTTSEFVDGNNLASDVKTELSNKDWVLRFAETDYDKTGQYIHTVFHYTEFFTAVSDVTILRLKFQTNGTIYNLGVVDNKQSGDLTPDNVTPKKMPLWLIILIIIGVILLLPILMPVLSVIFKAVFYVIKYVLQFLWWLITLPIKLIRGGD